MITRLRTAGCVYAEEEAVLLIAAEFTAEQLADAVDRRSAGFPWSTFSAGPSFAVSGLLSSQESSFPGAAAGSW